MVNTEEVVLMVQGLIKPEEHFIVDVKVSNSKFSRKVTVLIDSDEGIGIDDCSRISRALAERLEELIEGAYTLEVSSPGLESPLKIKRQYNKNIGKSLKIKKLDGEEIKGTLLNCTENAIELLPETKKKDKQVPALQQVFLKDIKEAKVMVTFN